MWHVRKAIDIEADTRRHKKTILITSGVTAFITLLFACFYLVRHTGVGTMQEHKDAIKDGYGFEVPGGNVYDQMCLELGHDRESGEYQDLTRDIAEMVRSEDDVSSGTHWSTVFVFNGVTLVLICLNAVLTMVGAFFFYPRLIAFVCNLLLTTIHFAAVVSTAVFRFQALGKLCALSI